MKPTPGTDRWLAQVREPIREPQQRIVDPHHHLWHDHRGRYELEELRRDTESGHRVEKTVFVECRANYRSEGPPHLAPVGETEYVAGLAKESQESPGAVISGIVSHADLTLPSRQLAEVLDLHEEAGGGLFRGIRHAGARDPHPEALRIAGRAPEGLYDRDDFRAGVEMLGDRGLTYDTWHYHHQNPAFERLARAVPGTTLVLDHFGTPLGVGPYRDRRTEIFEHWREDIASLALCPNVVAKLGGLAMPDNGFGWSERAEPASSNELVQAQAPYYLHTIECFGVPRCLFESNFPVDKLSISYPVLWNALKQIAEPFSAAERDALFAENAERIYRI